MLVRCNEEGIRYKEGIEVGKAETLSTRITNNEIP